MVSQSLPQGYAFRDAPPDLQKYLELRRVNDLSPKSETQGQGALTGSWAWTTIVHQADEASEPEVVGMVRAIGDGGWYFVIADMAVLVEHRRKGLGEALLMRLLQKIQEAVPEGALITLLADEMGRSLYKKCGFMESAPRSVGMWLPTGVEADK